MNIKSISGKVLALLVALIGIGEGNASAQTVNVSVRNATIVPSGTGSALQLDIYLSQGSSYALTVGTGYTNGNLRYDIAPALTGGTGTLTFTTASFSIAQSPAPLTSTNVFTSATTGTIGSCATCTPSNGYPGVGGTAGTAAGFSVNLQRPAGTANEIPLTPTKLLTVTLPYTISTTSGTPTLNLATSTIALRNYNNAAAARWNSSAAGPYLFSPNVGSQTLSATALPLELTEFNANNNGDNRTLLQWATVKEQNTASFEVQRSVNGDNFTETVARVRAAGKSSSLLKYQSYDNQPLPGANYYRLKMIDIDGKYSYSATRKVTFEGKTPEVVVYPTENYDGVLHVTLPQEWAEAQMHLINAVGQTIAAPIEGLGLSRAIQLGTLPSGIYTLQVTSGQAAQTFRISYQH